MGMGYMLAVLLLLPLVSLGDDLDLLYDDSQVAIIEITVDPQALTWIYDNVQSDSLHQSTVHFTNAHIDETIENVGFRLRGNTSRNAEKKSFKLSFNSFVPGRKFYDVEKLNLNGEHNDPSIIRSKIAWDHYGQTSLSAPRAAHCAVYINEVYYGLYISVQHIDEEFLKHEFADDSGNLWKCLWPADLTYRGPNASDYYPYWDDRRPYELKTNVETYDYNELAQLITTLHLTPQETLPDSLEQVLVVSDVLKYAAMNVLLGNWDDYWFLRNNFYLYHEPARDQIRFIPYDYDNNLGIDWFNVDWTAVDPYDFITIEETQGDAPGARPLMERIMEIPQYRNLYTHILEFYQHHITELSLWEPRLDSLKTMITPWVELDTFRTKDYGFTLSDFHQSFSSDSYENQHVKNGVKEFINTRHETLTDQLIYDEAPPIIYELKFEPLYPGPEDSIYVSVAAFSHAGLDSLSIAYHPGVLTVILDYPMRFEPLLTTPSIEAVDRWVGVIPPLGEGGHGRFQVSATDMNGQSMLYPRSHFEFIRVPGSSDIPLLLNEFMADNQTTVPDATGEYDDWLEIVNPGPDDIHMNGFYLTDDPYNLTKWRFPQEDITLESGGHLLVWCDEDQEQEGIHTNFKLSRTGEFIALVGHDGSTIIDALNFGPQYMDTSYGRVPDGGPVWDFIANPTPGSANWTSNLDDRAMIPTSLQLNNFPNPFNHQTIIRYILPETALVILEVIDIQGRLVRTLVHEAQVAGGQQVIWNGLSDTGEMVSAGLYFVRGTQGDMIQSHKMLLLK